VGKFEWEVGTVAGTGTVIGTGTGTVIGTGTVAGIGSGTVELLNL